MCADNLDEVQQPFRTCPASLFRVERVPEAEGAVGLVAVLRRDSGLGVDAREVLGLLAVCGIGRARVEADPDVDAVELAYDVESGESVRQRPSAVSVLECVAEVLPGVPFERGPPCRLDPVPEGHGGQSPQARGRVDVPSPVASPSPEAAVPPARTVRARRAASSCVPSASVTSSGSTWCSACCALRIYHLEFAGHGAGVGGGLCTRAGRGRLSGVKIVCRRAISMLVSPSRERGGVTDVQAELGEDAPVLQVGHPKIAVKYVHAAHPDKALPRIR
ncbi:hypothetical protein BX281_0581 [Streptomyces sp. Ag82_O1-15]|nr:hypothetical protein BX281_0581 [Streptomyces sp. Ag82_O1-15]